MSGPSATAVVDVGQPRDAERQVDGGFVDSKGELSRSSSTFCACPCIVRRASTRVVAQNRERV
jgi:hypothetical protein